MVVAKRVLFSRRRLEVASPTLRLPRGPLRSLERRQLLRLRPSAAPTASRSSVTYPITLRTGLLCRIWGGGRQTCDSPICCLRLLSPDSLLVPAAVAVVEALEEEELTEEEVVGCRTLLLCVEVVQAEREVAEANEVVVEDQVEVLRACLADPGHSRARLLDHVGSVLSLADEVEEG